MVENPPEKTNDAPGAGAPEQEPLPPIPDGGLSEVMPGWLRQPPSTATSAATAEHPADTPVADLDPAGFLTEDDLPDWLRQLSATAGPPAPSAANEGAAPPPSPAPAPPVATARIEIPQRQPAPERSGPSPASATTGERVSPQPSPIPEPRPAPLPPREADPSTPQTNSAASPQPPVPEVDPVDANRGVIITGIVLVALTAVIVIYLLVTGIL